MDTICFTCIIVRLDRGKIYLGSSQIQIIILRSGGNLSCDCDRSSPGWKLNQTDWSAFKPSDKGGLKCSTPSPADSQTNCLSVSLDKNSHHLPPKSVFPRPSVVVMVVLI